MVIWLKPPTTTRSTENPPGDHRGFLHRRTCEVPDPLRSRNREERSLRYADGELLLLGAAPKRC